MVIHMGTSGLRPIFMTDSLVRKYSQLNFNPVLGIDALYDPFSGAYSNS